MTIGRDTLKLFALALLAGLLAAPARAADPGASDWNDNDSGQVRLIAATTAVGTKASLKAGLQFQLKPGWHIYWRTPGDAGYPPKLDWSQSANIGTPTLSWPVPERIVLSGLQNFGYTGDVVLPLAIPVSQPGEPVTLTANLDYLACASLCVPMQAHLSLTLPAGPTAPSAFVHAIGRATAQVPGDGALSGLSLTGTPWADGQGDATLLHLGIAATQPLVHPDAIVEAPDGIAFGPPTVALAADGHRAELTLPVEKDSLTKPLPGTALTITLIDGERTMETRATVSAATPTVAPARAPAGAPLLASMLGLAFLGGLILNLMPCVLPVLSIKILGVLGMGGAERRHVRAAFLASAAGILVSFLALAGLAIGLKSAGAAVGWGIQFQHSGFLAALVVMLSLFAANLWGLFEIPLPSWLASRTPGGGSAAPGGHHALAAHFLSGAFATLLATPCSAPFLGTAVGFALARGPGEILGIFAMLGVGMATPFLAVALRPGLAARLPRPGRWMVAVKRVLSLALVATALWLLAVLDHQSGRLPALLVAGAMIAAVILLGLRHRLPASSQSAVGLATAALAAVALVAPTHGIPAGTQAAASNSASDPLTWVPLDTGTIATAVAAGKVVFVDVTADWCITCKVNKAGVVDRGAVAQRLRHPDVVAMKGDWTRPDDHITAYLASFGRYGVPFNAVYGPAAPNGILLPELLTEADTLAAIDQAAGHPAAAAAPAGQSG